MDQHGCVYQYIITIAYTQTHIYKHAEVAACNRFFAINDDYRQGQVHCVSQSFR